MDTGGAQLEKDKIAECFAASGCAAAAAQYWTHFKNCCRPISHLDTKTRGNKVQVANIYVSLLGVFNILTQKKKPFPINMNVLPCSLQNQFMQYSPCPRTNNS